MSLLYSRPYMVQKLSKEKCRHLSVSFATKTWIWTSSCVCCRWRLHGENTVVLQTTNDTCCRTLLYIIQVRWILHNAFQIYNASSHFWSCLSSIIKEYDRNSDELRYSYSFGTVFLITIGCWFVKIWSFGFILGHKIWGLNLHFNLKFQIITKEENQHYGQPEVQSHSSLSIGRQYASLFSLITP